MHISHKLGGIPICGWPARKKDGETQTIHTLMLVPEPYKQELCKGCGQECMDILNEGFSHGKITLAALIYAAVRLRLFNQHPSHDQIPDKGD